MNSIEILKELYTTKLKQELKDLEIQRKKVFLYFIGIFLMLISAFACFVTGDDKFIVICAFAFIILSIVSSILFHSNNIYYKKIFKANVVGKIIGIIDESWRYNPESYINQAEYKKSGFFSAKPDLYIGDDLISGIIDKTDFRMSEVHAKCNTHYGEQRGNTIFKGLFAQIDFNKNIKGKTIVLTDFAERLFGKFGQNLQSNDSRGKLVKLENAEFEKYFAVYSDDQIEARYILTLTMMEAIVNIRKRLNRKIYISFIGSSVYIAIPYAKRLFEPRIIRSGVRFIDIEQMYYQFKIISLIIDEMNLNTRIWTKD